VIVPFPYKEAWPTKEIIFFGSKNLLNKILSLFEGDTTTLTYKVGCYRGTQIFIEKMPSYLQSPNINN